MLKKRGNKIKYAIKIKKVEKKKYEYKRYENVHNNS